ncbi:hypothetical protein ILYODFUR_015488 [Ilyodon furcidens]|uniref:Uncharacterized protein n=1 Tax=Ilyodon furcidens TaxID=33524 RepID=A0ABV0U9W4_9TELE
MTTPGGVASGSRQTGFSPWTNTSRGSAKSIWTLRRSHRCQFADDEVTWQPQRWRTFGVWLWPFSSCGCLW